MIIPSWLKLLTTAQEKQHCRSKDRCDHLPRLKVAGSLREPKSRSRREGTTIPIRPAVEALEDRMAPALFQAPIVTGTGGLNPVSVADTNFFTGSNKFDLAVVNNRTNNATLSVLFGNGNGTFRQGPIFAVGNSATSVAVGDFNGDGNNDIAVADPVDNSIAIFLGHGDGTFTQGVSDFITGGPAELAASDFNGDHISDLAVGFNNGQVWWLRGSPTGFTSFFIESPGGPVTAIAAGLINNDGNPDIVTASEQRAVVVKVFLGNGTGTFSVAPGSPISLTATQATSMALGNFRGISGRQDLVVANGPNNTVTLLLSNGNGSFQAPTTLSAPGQPFWVVARDFDLDGNVDFVTSNSSTTSVTARLGKGDGTFKAAQNFAAGSVPTGLAIGDFNNDGKPDLVVADNGNAVTGVGSAVSVLLNGSTGLDYIFAGPTTAVAGTQFQFTVTVKDFHGVLDSAYRGTIHFTSSDSFAVLPSDYTFTAADAGIHTFMATLQSSGTQTITGTDTSDSTINGSITITVSNPVPVLTGLGQTSAQEGSSDLSISVTGSGFSATSVVQWNGTALATSFSDNSHLQATIPAADLADEGTANVTVFNPTPGGGTSSPITFTITDANLTATGTPVVATEGAVLSAQVATFTDANPKAPLSDFSTGTGAVTIDWGDGNQSAGMVFQPGGIGTMFVVRGTHTYAEDGTQPITVTITDEGSATTTANTSATIGDAPLSISVAPIKEVPGNAFSGQVATFLDANKTAPLSDFNGLGGASINWGDGTTTPGTVSQPGGIGTAFIVNGTHTYATGDNHIFKVTVTDVGGSTVTGQALAGDFQPHDIAGRLASNGQWWVGTSNGSDAFSNSLWATWNPAATWVDVQTGDFTGDGKTDIIGRDLSSGTWWVGVSNGTGFTTSLWATWNPNATWVDVHVGDFNHDGKADIVGRYLQGGQWWVGLSTGSSFATSLWATWNPNVTWVDAHVGDFNGDGSSDITARWLQGGQWFVGLSNGSSAFTAALWTTWSPAVTWVDVQVGDFNGDGKDDIAGRVSQNGQWWLGISNGSSFANALWGGWSPAVTWVDVQVGDFNGDGFTDIIGRVLQTGQWWVAFSNGSNAFSSILWAQWNPNVNWVDVQVGDFNADGRDDITGRYSAAGQWWTSLSQGTTSTTSLWDTWSNAVKWVDVHNGVFVRV